MLFGNRIRLRAPERSDIPAFVTWMNDPEVRAGIFQITPLSQVEEENWFDAMMRAPAAEHPLVIEVRDGQGWKRIGNTGFNSIDQVSRVAEIGIFIGEKEYWNQGYGGEALTVMLEHGFHTLNFNRIYLRVYETNPRAIHCYEKIGFVHEGRLRQALFQDGRYVDILIMGFLREEYQQRKSQL